MFLRHTWFTILMSKPFWKTILGNPGWGTKICLAFYYLYTHGFQKHAYFSMCFMPVFKLFWTLTRIRTLIFTQKYEIIRAILPNSPPKWPKSYKIWFFYIICTSFWQKRGKSFFLTFSGSVRCPYEYRPKIGK